MSRKRSKPPADVLDDEDTESSGSSNTKRQRMISRNGNAPSQSGSGKELRLMISNDPSSSSEHWFGCAWIPAELTLTDGNGTHSSPNNSSSTGDDSTIGSNKNVTSDKDSTTMISNGSELMNPKNVCSGISGMINVRLVFENGESVPDDFDFTVRQNGIEQRPQSQLITEFNRSSSSGSDNSEMVADCDTSTTHCNCCTVALTDGICIFEVRMNSFSIYHENRKFKLVYSLLSLSMKQSRGNSNVQGCESSVFRLVKNKLIVTRQPLSKFYKDEGGKGNCLECDFTLIDNCRNIETKRGKIPLSVRLLYSDDLSPAQSQRDILEVLTSNPELIDGKCVLHFRINEVSKNHNKRAFCLIVECSADEPLYQDISPAITQPIMVYSKRTKKAAVGRGSSKRRRNNYNHFDSGGGGGSSSSSLRGINHSNHNSFMDDGLSGVDPNSGFIPPHVQSGALPGAPIVLPFSARIRDRVFKREDGGTNGEQKGVFHTMIEWCQLAEWVMRILEWVHCGYEMDPTTAAIDPRRPLYRCCFCLKYRNCAGFGTHESDCQLKLALNQYATKLNNLPTEFAFQSNRTDTAMASTDGAVGSMPSTVLPPPPQSLMGPTAPTGGNSDGRNSVNRNNPAASHGHSTTNNASNLSALMYGAMNPVMFPGMLGAPVSVGAPSMFGSSNTFRPFQSPSNDGQSNHHTMATSLPTSSPGSSRSASAHQSTGLSKLQAKLPGELEQVTSVSKERSDYGFPAFDRSQKLVGFIDDSGLRSIDEFGMTHGDFNSDFFLAPDNMLTRNESNPFHFTDTVTKMVSSGYGLDKH